MQESSTPKTLLIFPAFNEEPNIPFVVKTAQRLQAEGAIHGFAIIDDHSTDRTAQLAKEAGALVLPQSVSQSSGKGQAFLTGLHWAKNEGADLLVTLDADLVPEYPVTSKNVLSMVEQLIDIPTLDMVVHPQIEIFSTTPPPGRDTKFVTTPMGISGQRALRVDALNFLFNKSADGSFRFSDSNPASRFIRAATGFGLEIALNVTLKSSLNLPGDHLSAICTQKPHRKPGDFGIQHEDIYRTKTFFTQRREHLAKLRADRNLRQALTTLMRKL